MSHRPKTVLRTISLTACSSARLIFPELLWTAFSGFMLFSSVAADYLENFLEHRHVFARGDHEDTALRLRGCNVGIRPAHGVRMGIQVQAEALKASADRLPHFG